MNQKHWKVFTAAILLAVMGATTLRARAGRPGPARSGTVARPPVALVERLNGVLGQRFADIADGTFGLSRLVTTPSHAGFQRLKAETSEEKRVFQQVRQDGWDTLFYVAGHHAMKSVASAPNAKLKPAGPSRRLNSHRRVSPPVLLVGAGKRDDAPTEAVLLPHVQTSFKHFRAGDRHEFRIGEWYLASRPVRATRRSCLGCHRKDERGVELKLGDTLGVAIYAFSRPPAQRGSGDRAPAKL